MIEPPAEPRPRDDAAARDVAVRVEEIFREAGAYREGHFLLKSGRHADRYLEKFQVLQHPALVTELCRFVADRAWGSSGVPLVDVVAGPTTGGVILAFETGRQLGVRAIFAEEVRAPDGGVRREFRRGFRVAADERVLLVDDILTTGGSLVAMLPALEAAGAEVPLLIVLVDRSGGMRELASPASGRRYAVEALWRLDLPTYEAGDACPGCRASAPLEAPGSTGVAAS